MASKYQLLPPCLPVRLLTCLSQRWISRSSYPTSNLLTYLPALAPTFLMPARRWISRSDLLTYLPVSALDQPILPTFLGAGLETSRLTAIPGRRP